MELCRTNEQEISDLFFHVIERKEFIPVQLCGLSPQRCEDTQMFSLLSDLLLSNHDTTIFGLLFRHCFQPLPGTLIDSSVYFFGK